MKKSLIWLRRSLRLRDNKVIEKAIESVAANNGQIYICFVFDESILAHFPNKEDRRLSFIANHLELIDQYLKQHGGSVNVLFGKPEAEIARFAAENNISEVFCDMDFEPSSKDRDGEMAKILEGKGVKFTPVLDHILIHPDRILKGDGTAYKVFTPFMKRFREVLEEQGASLFAKPSYNFDSKVAQQDIAFDKEKMLEKAGYVYKDDPMWHPAKAVETFKNFLHNKLASYSEKRNMLYGDHTSAISPYLRFGALPIREVFQEPLIREGRGIAPTYVNELIWREFYVYIMHHFPYAVHSEFQEKYHGKIQWSENEAKLNAFCEGKTGFPVVDAAIRELIQTGWMHNRARMIVASFFTKNLFMDWRVGEKFFAKYLMDYDLASNVGGWQWTASTGTDAQPYFRVFNPISQGQTHDPNGEYIKKYVEELKGVSSADLHNPDALVGRYYRPIADLKKSREYAIQVFKGV